MLFRLLLPCWLLLLAGCGSNTTVIGSHTTETLAIHRFDSALFDWIGTDSPEKAARLQTDYNPMLAVLGRSLFNMPDTPAAPLMERIINYYSEPTLNRLYRDAIDTFSRTDQIAAELTTAFDYLHRHFPTMQTPAVYMHVSGFNRNVIVADSLLSISIDRYLGSDYPLYADFFPPYQRRRMTPEFVVPDYLTGWLMSEYPFKGDERILLDEMIYAGKIAYILLKALPDRSFQSLMGYTPDEMQWFAENEQAIWHEIIARKHLYTPDRLTTAKYISDAPAQFLADRAPGKLGTSVGFQIVSEYMERHRHITPQQLMENNDAQYILNKSNYKP